MIQTAEVSITYKGDGVQTSFPYPYPYRNSADIIGYIINDIGYETRITTNFKYDEVSNTYQYPLSGEPISSSYSIKLIRETPQQQNAALPSKLPFSLIEKSLDWIIMILQEIGSRSNNLWNTRNDCKLSETNARNSASAAANSEDKARLSENNAKRSANAAANSENMVKKWAIDTTSPDGATDNDSYTGKTQSSRTWALYSKEQAQAAKVSETNAKDFETNAKDSATKAALSEDNAKTSETKAATSATEAALSEDNARTSETNAANSAKQAAESAGVFQDFTGATATTDGTGGKVPKPLAGQQNKVLKADGTWGDGVTPKTLWDGMHSYPVNYIPADLSNVGWNQLGFCSIYYTQNKINNQPTQYGQLINIPAAANNESTQLWIEQSGGKLFSRGGNGNIRVDDTPFKGYATLDDVDRAEKAVSQGTNWIRYNSGLQMCWNNRLEHAQTWTFPVPFSVTPVVVAFALPSDAPADVHWLMHLSNTSCAIVQEGDGHYSNVLAIGRWK